MAQDLESQVYGIKHIQLFNSSYSIVCQNENGPCPLIAIINLLILSNKIVLRQADNVQAQELLDLLAVNLIDTNQVSESDQSSYAANIRQNVADSIERLPKLATGIDVNLHFHDSKAFEFTSETGIFHILDISILHGWLYDPLSQPEVARIIGQKTYNEMQIALLVLVDQGQIEKSSLSFNSQQNVSQGQRQSSKDKCPQNGGGTQQKMALGGQQKVQEEVVAPKQEEVSGVDSDEIKKRMREFNIKLADDELSEEEQQDKLLRERFECLQRDSQELQYMKYEEVPQHIQDLLKQDTGSLALNQSGRLSFSHGTPTVEAYNVEPYRQGQDIQTINEDEALVSSKDDIAYNTQPQNFNSGGRSKQSETINGEQKVNILQNGSDFRNGGGGGVNTPTQMNDNNIGQGHIQGTQAGKQQVQEQQHLQSKQQLQDCSSQSQTQNGKVSNQSQQLNGNIQRDSYIKQDQGLTYAIDPFRQQQDKGLSQGQDSKQDQQTRDALIVNQFFEHTSSQLTMYGLQQLHASTENNKLAVFFRNNHFNTLYKYQDNLYILVTDQGYLLESNIIWEKLDVIDGDTEFFNGRFEPLRPDQINQANSKNPAAAYQESQDLALALQMQEEEQNTHNAAPRKQAPNHHHHHLQQQQQQQQSLNNPQQLFESEQDLYSQKHIEEQRRIEEEIRQQNSQQQARMHPQGQKQSIPDPYITEQRSSNQSQGVHNKLTSWLSGSSNNQQQSYQQMQPNQQQHFQQQQQQKQQQNYFSQPVGQQYGDQQHGQTYNQSFQQQPYQQTYQQNNPQQQQQQQQYPQQQYSQQQYPQQQYSQQQRPGAQHGGQRQGKFFNKILEFFK